MGKPYVIGIAGGTGSGKTTVARPVYEGLHVNSAAFLDQDSYYKDLGHLTLEERRRVNFDHPDSFDNALLAAHVQALVAGRAVEKPIYDFTVSTRTARTKRVEPRTVVLVEGILLFVEPELRELIDLKIFVDAEADVRFIRRLRRDIEVRGRSVENVVEQYMATVRPMHWEFVEPSKRYADVILPRGGHNRAGIEVVAARVREQLARRGEGVLV